MHGLPSLIGCGRFKSYSRKRVMGVVWEAKELPLINRPEREVSSRKAVLRNHA
jgi:hypothetical protein